MHLMTARHQYRCEMEKLATWEGELEMRAAVTQRKVIIVVFSEQGSKLYVYNDKPGISLPVVALHNGYSRDRHIRVPFAGVWQQVVQRITPREMKKK